MTSWLEKCFETDDQYRFAPQVWKGRYEDAVASGNPLKIQEAADMCVLYESLQLAHKCILNRQARPLRLLLFIYSNHAMRASWTWKCLSWNRLCTDFCSLASSTDKPDRCGTAVYITATMP